MPDVEEDPTPLEPKRSAWFRQLLPFLIVAVTTIVILVVLNTHIWERITTLPKPPPEEKETTDE